MNTENINNEGVATVDNESNIRIDADNANADLISELFPTEEAPAPKKRGRKKKSEAAVDNATAGTATEEKPRRRRRKSEGEESTEAQEAPKKRGRKKKADIEPEQIDMFSAEDNAAPEVTDEIVDTSIEEITLPESGDALTVSEEAVPETEITEGIEVPDAPIFDENSVELDMLGDPIKEDECETEVTEDTPVVYKPRPLTKKEPKYDEENPRRVDFIFDFIELFIYTLVAVLVITTFFVRHSVVEGSSMDNTLHDGDVLIISDFMYSPSHKDIIVVQDTSTSLPKPIVKRIIGVGGDVVRVAREGIYLNGELLKESYVYTDNLNYTYHNLPADEIFNYPGFSIRFEEKDGKQLLLYYEFVVPEGELFVMGDHRNVSTDSRAIGTVKEEAILGRVLFRLFPFDVFGAVN